MHDIAPGTPIGAYVVEEPISAGGMGAVYRGCRLEDGYDVALKVLLEERNLPRFEIEARLLSRLRHPRVVRVIDYVVDDGLRCLVMELVRGSSLADRLVRHGPIPVDEAIGHALQACEALAYVHAQRVVHRDVKPANLIEADRGIVLVDFGIARSTEAATRSTVGIGTPRFMAPEVLAGGSVSPRSDVFGLGATLWTLVTGEPPRFLERASLTERVRGVDRSLDRAVRAALEPDPYLRLASVEAFARALGPEGLATDAGTPLGISVERATVPRPVLETVVRSAAGVFDAAAASIALFDFESEELVYESAWGAGADEIVGVRLPRGTGIAGAVLCAQEGEAIASCADDPRFAGRVASGTGYVPNTMLALPLVRGQRAFGVLQVLDRRDGAPFGPSDLQRASALIEMVQALFDAIGGETAAAD